MKKKTEKKDLEPTYNADVDEWLSLIADPEEIETKVMDALDSIGTIDGTGMARPWIDSRCDRVRAE